MGLFNMFKKKATKRNCTYELKGNNIQTSSAKIEKQQSANGKPNFLNKCCCARCGYNLDLLEPTQIMVNEEGGKEYCDICIKKLNSEKEYAISIGTTITLKNATICTPNMGVYPENIYQRLVVCENGYLVATSISDANGDQTYSEEIIEGGFFTKSSISEIAKKLSLYVDYIQSDYKLLKLIEYDKKTYGQSL